MEMGIPAFNHLHAMIESKKYDVCIIGGGLAGLAASILVANHGYEVALI